MPLPLAIWIWWTAMLGYPEWNSREKENNQK